METMSMNMLRTIYLQLSEYLTTLFYGTPTIHAQPEVTKVKISGSLELWKVKDSNESLPMVLLFPWLTANERSVQKYRSFYHEKKMNVLVIHGYLREFLWPPLGFKLAEEINCYLNTLPSSKRFLVHSFSNGIYIYTLTRMHLKLGKQSFPSDQVIGQIFDSIVLGGPVKMTQAIAESITRNTFLQRCIVNVSKFYLHLTKKWTLDCYEKVTDFFKEEFLTVPTLFFYSENDSMCDVATRKDLLAYLKNKHVDKILEQSWEKSAHAGHLRLHENDYLSKWNSLLEKLSEVDYRFKVLSL